MHCLTPRGGSLLYVANERTRVIHDAENSTDRCGLYSETTADQVSVRDEHAVRRMIQSEKFRPCPECMLDQSWE